MSWFDVDKEGLAKHLEKRGKACALFELIQNGWDQQVTRVDVTLEALPNRPLAKLIVADDDPEGFKDLSHAFTLFAESTKKKDPEKRGRFNVGEKWVLAVCESATISSTTGTVIFENQKRTVHRRSRRERGSEFTGILRMTRAEYQEVGNAIQSLIPPLDIVTTFNGQRLVCRTALRTFEATLPTEISDDTGIVRKTVRRTKVSVYEPRDGETASIYEMGIPVVEVGDRWHIDVSQKIPLNIDRDNVTLSYLRELRTAVLNEMRDYLTPEDANSQWVNEAISNPKISNEAVSKVITTRFGDRRVSFDPSDPEANKIAVFEGYQLIHGGSFPKAAWENIRRAEAVQPAGKVTPSPGRHYDPSGQPEEVVQEKDYTDGMRLITDYARQLAMLLMNISIQVRIVNDKKETALAWYSAGRQELAFNLGKLGRKWFSSGITDAVNALLIHEFGHQYEEDHLSPAYHAALCNLGARLTRAALEVPEFFQGFATDQSTSPEIWTASKAGHPNEGLVLS